MPLLQAVTALTSVLGVTSSEAALLLRYYKWSVTRVHDEWFQVTPSPHGS